MNRKEQVQAGFTVVVNMRKNSPDKKLISWAKRNGLFVRIDRKSIYGNPFKMKGKTLAARLESIDKFKDYLEAKKHEVCGGCCGGNPAPIIEGIIHELPGKVLGCWCYPEPCHGDILAQSVNQSVEVKVEPTSTKPEQLNLFQIT